MDIIVELVLNNICNFSCWYCCANMQYHQSNNTIDIINVERLSFYIQKYLTSSNVHFHLLGGEPLLYNRLSDLYKILSRLNNIEILMFTNASIPFSPNFISIINRCIENDIKITFDFSYHRDILEKREEYAKNFWNNLSLITNNTNSIIACSFLYDNNTKNEIFNIAKEYTKHFKNIKISCKEIILNEKQRERKWPSYSNITCYPFRYIGISSSNYIYYSCFRDMHGDKCQHWKFTKANILNIISNINRPHFFTKCTPHYCKILNDGISI